jgi:putative dimethyl sulfoxide reductase chaperone
MPSEANPRAQLYALLARLFLDELDRPLACYLRGLPGLAEHIPPDAELGDWLADMRAEHQRLFGLNVYPYESIFRDRELMLNSAATQPVAALYAASGFTPAARSRAGAPDHLGFELALMAELAARPPHDDIAQSHMATLLHNHLAAWLPACAEALDRVARAPLHHALTETVVELVLGELAECGAVPPLPQPRSHQGRGEPESANLGRGEPESAHHWLGDSVVGEPILPLSPAWERGSGGEGSGDDLDLRWLVRHLLTPDEVGVFISRADIAEIAHALALPAPVAERGQMLVALFQAAGSFELVPALLVALGERLRAADATYARLVAAHPAWASYGRAWRGRVAHGLALLERLAGDLHEDNGSRIEDRG